MDGIDYGNPFVSKLSLMTTIKGYNRIFQIGCMWIVQKSHENSPIKTACPKICTLSISLDLPWGVVMLYLYRDYSISEIADLLIISTKSVSRILTKFYDTSDV